MDDSAIQKLIKEHEGFRPYVYYDSLGFPTGGYGHAFLPHSPISHKVADTLFKEDFERVKDDYEKLKLNLDSVRRAVILDMLFNLGLTKIRCFHKMFKALREGDFEEAAKEMLDSKWARQVGGRSFHLAQMMRRGEV